MANFAEEQACAIATVVGAPVSVVYSTLVHAQQSLLVALLWRTDYYYGTVTRLAPLSDLPVLLGGDPDVRSVLVPLFEDVPLHIPFLPSLPAFEEGPGHRFERVVVVEM